VRQSGQDLRRARAIESEFQSDAVEIEERIPPRLAFLTLYLLAALILVAITWASISLVDKIAVAPGKLITTQPNLVVQPLETSVVRSIDVVVGEVVRKGQALARLDSTFTQSDVEQLQTKANSLDSRIRRLEAELAEEDYTIPGGARPDEVLEQRVYAQRKALYQAQIRNFDEKIAAAEASLATLGQEQAVLRQRLGKLQEIEGMRTELFERQSGSRLNLLLSQDARLSIDANLARNAGSMVETQHAIEKARAEKLSATEEFRRTSVEQLVEASNQQKIVLEELNKARLRQRMVVLTAPMDAVVLDIAQRSIGSVVREAEPMFTLVPADVPIEAEVSVDAKDIGLVAVGQIVRVKFDAFPFQIHGTATGVVRTISQDAFANDPRSDPQLRSPLYYRARIELIDTNLRGVPKSFRLMSGMAVTAEIKVGHRTVISYFIDPLLRGLDESIREP
jgi:HlyD family secretion protein